MSVHRFRHLLVASVLSLFVLGALPVRGSQIITFIQANRATLENIRAVDAKAALNQETIAPAIEKSSDSVEQAAWHVLAGFATGDYRQNCADGIAAFETARRLTAKMDLDQRRELIAILEHPDFIDFKVATRLPMGYNAYAVKRLEQGGAAADAMTRQLKGWTDYYSAILEFLFALSQPLDRCGVCATCLDCPLYKFKVTFYNFKALLNQDEFYTQLNFIKQAATRAQDLGRAIESRYDLQ